MNRYKFTERVEDVSDLLLENLGTDYLIPNDQDEEDTVVYFHNGDKMTVNLSDRTFEWEPIQPGCAFTSGLSLVFHKWFVKGYFKVIEES